MDHQHPEPIVEHIIALAGQGLSRGVIAAQVGLSRSSVCGILWRRGIKSPVVTRPTKRPKRDQARKRSSKAKRAKDKAAAIAAAAVKAAAIEAAAKAAPVSSGIRWADLNSSHQCRWPLDGGLWCGEAKTTGSYCDRHFNLSRRPPVIR